MFKAPENRSFFIFGPRGTGKSSWLKQHFRGYPFVDLLDDATFRMLTARPESLAELFKPGAPWVVIDEMQRVPAILNEVHRLIESSSTKFALSGSSARKLKREGTNLLAGRALTKHMYPLTSRELGSDFDLTRALTLGTLPEIWDEHLGKEYLESYVTTYLKEEIQQEGLSRNLGAFSRFLEAASFAQAAPLNVSKVAQQVGIDSKSAESYFTILEDLLLAFRLPVFQKHAKREMYRRNKFMFFDVGVYRSIRPRGPIDTPEYIDGAALETLLFQEMMALNEYFRLGFDFFYWRTRTQLEIDFVLYGERGIIAIEVKRNSNPRKQDLRALRQFREDYPSARTIMLYGGTKRLYKEQIELIPFAEGLLNIEQLLTE